MFLFNILKKKEPLHKYTCRIENRPIRTSCTLSLPAEGVDTEAPVKSSVQSSCAIMDNQQSEGDCTAEAWKNGYWQALVAQGLPGKLISRQYLYYYERLHMGPEYVFQDSGAALSDGAYVLTSRGVCVESLWPYWQQLNMSITPPFWCDFNAVKNKVTKAEQVPQTLAAIKHVIGVNGRTVQCGINVFSSLESAATLASGNVPMPAASETLLGGHAISLVGYDDSVEQILWKNSWGTGIGVNGTGYFTLPYEYILDSKLASDFWAIDQAQ